MKTKPLAFPKSVRLLTKEEYQAVFAGSCMVSDSTLVVFALPNTLNTARLGLAISKKCSKRAVDRNHVKRALREAFRLARSQLPALDFVVICRSGAAGLPCSVLGASLMKQIAKVRRRTCAGSL